MVRKALEKIMVEVYNRQQGGYGFSAWEVKGEDGKTRTRIIQTKHMEDGVAIETALIPIKLETWWRLYTAFRNAVERQEK